MLHGWANRMASVFVEWNGSGREHEYRVAQIQDSVCFCLHRLSWRECFFVGARKMICQLEAPDAESVRVALRQARINVDAVWAGSVHDVGEPGTANVAVERRFLAQLPANAEETVAWLQKAWLKPSGLSLVRAIVPHSRDRVICLCAVAAHDGTFAPAGTGYDSIRSVRRASRVAR
jgi:hypothetical protein